MNICSSCTSSGRIPRTTVFPAYPPSISFLAFAGGSSISEGPATKYTLSPTTLHVASTKFICGDPMNPATNWLHG